MTDSRVVYRQYQAFRAVYSRKTSPPTPTVEQQETVPASWLWALIRKCMHACKCRIATNPNFLCRRLCHCFVRNLTVHFDFDTLCYISHVSWWVGAEVRVPVAIVTD